MHRNCLNLQLNIGDIKRSSGAVPYLLAGDDPPMTNRALTIHLRSVKGLDDLVRSRRQHGVSQQVDDWLMVAEWEREKT